MKFRLPLHAAMHSNAGGNTATLCAMRMMRRPPMTSARLPPTRINNIVGTSIVICATPTICGDSCNTIVTSQANITD